MGTRSIVGFVDGESIRGRYCHWDGYPSYMGKTLVDIVHKSCGGSIEQAIKILCHEHPGWSNLGTGKHELTVGYDDGRFEAVDGFGIAYVAPQQIDEDTWYVFPSENPDAMWAEFAYAFNTESRNLSVFKIENDELRLLTTVSVDDPLVNWQAIEDIAWPRGDADPLVEE